MDDWWGILGDYVWDMPLMLLMVEAVNGWRLLTLQSVGVGTQAQLSFYSVKLNAIHFYDQIFSCHVSLSSRSSLLKWLVFKSNTTQERIMQKESGHLQWCAKIMGHESFSGSFQEYIVV